MSLSLFPLVVFLSLACMTFAQPFMGPASFAWPLPRAWNRTSDDVQPCGLSPQGRRSKFPLRMFFSLLPWLLVLTVSRQWVPGTCLPIWDAEPWGESLIRFGYVFILHVPFLLFPYSLDTFLCTKPTRCKKDPKSVADFSYVLRWRISNYGAGFTCFNIPDAPSGMDAGANATFQMRFDSNYETPLPRSYFSCADITYVEREGLDFPDAQFPCLNTTDVKWEYLPTPTKKDDPPEPTTTPWSPREGKKKPLDSAAIAGISIGGAIVLMGIIVFLYKKLWKPSKPKNRQAVVPCKWERGSYGLPDLVAVSFDFFGIPTRRG